jgi:predicted amidohydrolase YtcJ
MAERPADLVLLGAPVYTMDAARRWASFVAVTANRITAVGHDGRMRDHIGPATEVVTLDGGLVLPAFQDAHIHALHGGLDELYCDLHEWHGVDDYLSAIAAYAADHPEREWIVGGGWSMDVFPRGTPHKSLIDAIVPDRPVYLPNRDWHGAWVNSKALELAGVDRDTPDPSGGRIERDDGGEPSGTLHEHAMDLVEKLMPRPTPDEFVQGLLIGQRRLHALGITAWQDASVTDEELDAYLTVDGRGELTSKVSLSLLWDRDRDESQIEDLRDARKRATVGNLRAGTVKIFQDGVVENYTAAMVEPYLDASGAPTENSGISMIEPESLKKYATRLVAEGFQLHFHAIGDRAVREALDAIETAGSENKNSVGLRHHIAHIQVVHPDDVGRFRTLGVVANAQPLWACMEPQMRDLTIPFLGPERTTHQYPFGDLHRAGAPIAFGSDWPVSTADPLQELEVAVTRVAPDTRSMEPFLPEQRLPLPDALAAFTIGSAYVNHLDESSGSIEPGKLADLTVLDRNPFDLDSGPIGDARVVLTLSEGRVVYERS